MKLVLNLTSHRRVCVCSVSALNSSITWRLYVLKVNEFQNERLLRLVALLTVYHRREPLNCEDNHQKDSLFQDESIPQLGFYRMS